MKSGHASDRKASGSAPAPRARARFSIDTRAWLLGGGVAIAVNTGLLFIAAHLGLQTGHGGLLKLLRPWITPVLEHTGLTQAWASMHLPSTGSTGFKVGFHVFVGMLMAAFYALVERYVPWRPWLKGLAYAAAVYLANALIVLPLLGQGVAGYRAASATGLVYFALVHTVFFLLLAWGYDRVCRQRAAQAN